MRFVPGKVKIGSDWSWAIKDTMSNGYKIISLWGKVSDINNNNLVKREARSLNLGATSKDCWAWEFDGADLVQSFVPINVAVTEKKYVPGM